MQGPFTAKQAKLALISIITNYVYTLYDRTDEDIAMTVCTPYDLHKAKPNEENEGAYEECEASPDAATDDSIYDL